MNNLIFYLAHTDMKIKKCPYLRVEDLQKLLQVSRSARPFLKIPVWPFFAHSWDFFLFIASGFNIDILH